MAETAIQTQKQSNVLIGGTVVASAMLFLCSIMATVGSGGTITLEASDVSTVGGGMLNVAQSLITMTIQFAPYIIGFVGATMLLSFLWGRMRTR